MSTTNSLQPWPVAQDYNEAIQDPATSFRDPESACRHAGAERPGHAAAALRQLRRRLRVHLSGHEDQVGAEMLHASRYRSARALQRDQPLSADGPPAVRRRVPVPGAGHSHPRAVVPDSEDALGRGPAAQRVRARLRGQAGAVAAVEPDLGADGQTAARGATGALRLAARQRRAGDGQPEVVAGRQA